jgi:acylphosphatase
VLLLFLESSLAGDAEGKDVSSLACLHATVLGKVQGVFFRAFVAKQAAELGLSGYARNLPDGSVDVMAEGGRSRLEKLLEYLRVGPPGARVDRVDADWPPYRGEFGSFDIQY